MKEVEMQYFEDLKKSVIEKISEEINEKMLSSIIANDIAFHIEDRASSKFQRFYFDSVNNPDYYYKSNDFFKQFKSNYSLQFITNQYLEVLEAKKHEMLNLIKQNELSKLYFKYFAKAKIEQTNGIIYKNLNSFFVKFVHTFQPNKYCALDNPIKNYFGLKNESFFVAFIILNESYNQWIKGNKSLIKKIRENMKEIDSKEIFDFEKLTDLKILDLIF